MKIFGTGTKQKKLSSSFATPFQKRNTHKARKNQCEMQIFQLKNTQTLKQNGEKKNR